MVRSATGHGPGPPTVGPMSAPPPSAPPAMPMSTPPPPPSSPPPPIMPASAPIMPELPLSPPVDVVPAGEPGLSREVHPIPPATRNATVNAERRMGNPPPSDMSQARYQPQHPSVS